MKFRYLDEHIAFLEAGYQTMLVPELTRAFNDRFGTDKSAGQITSTLKNRQITCGKGVNKARWTSLTFTREQYEWLKDNYPNHSRTDLTGKFNATFNTSKAGAQITAYLKNNRIVCGRDGRFTQGHVPWTAGKKGCLGANVTSFTKGNVPKNRVRLWSERIDASGLIQIKIPERNPYTGAPTRFKHKHVWLWEFYNGAVPKGNAITFRDGNKLNCSLENLIMVSREELLQLNLHSYSKQYDELKPSILAMVKVAAKAKIRGIRPANGGRKKKEQPA